MLLSHHKIVVQRSPEKSRKEENKDTGLALQLFTRKHKQFKLIQTLIEFNVGIHMKNRGAVDARYYGGERGMLALLE